MGWQAILVPNSLVSMVHQYAKEKLPIQFFAIVLLYSKIIDVSSILDYNQGVP
jgi:uncharacterized membrane-anchored protein